MLGPRVFWLMCLFYFYDVFSTTIVTCICSGRSPSASHKRWHWTWSWTWPWTGPWTGDSVGVRDILPKKVLFSAYDLPISSNVQPKITSLSFSLSPSPSPILAHPDLTNRTKKTNEGIYVICCIPVEWQCQDSLAFSYLEFQKEYNLKEWYL